MLMQDGSMNGEDKALWSDRQQRKVIGKVRDFESIEQSPDCPRIYKALAIPRDLHATLLTQYLRRHTST
jgi:hypothetical protein